MINTIIFSNTQKHAATFVMVAAMCFGVLSFTQPAYAQFSSTADGGASRDSGINSREGFSNGAAFDSGNLRSSYRPASPSSNAAISGGTTSHRTLQNMSRNELIALIQQLITRTLSGQGSPSTPVRTVVDQNPRGIGIGEQIETTDRLRVRAIAGLNGNTMRVVEPGSRGRIVEGPVRRDGNTWFRAAYDNGTTGWSAASWMRSVGNTSVMPEQDDAVTQIIADSDETTQTNDPQTSNRQQSDGANQSETIEVPAGDSYEFTANDFITVPVRIHMLSGTGEAAVDTTRTEAEIRDLFANEFGVNNRYWSQAGISFEIERIVENSPTQIDSYDTIAPEAKAVTYADVIRSQDYRGGFQLAQQLLIPESDMLEDGFNVVVVRDFGLMGGGVFTRNATHKVVIVPEIATQGESDEVMTFSFAHELGHALGLAHYDSRIDGYNMMSVGNSATHSAVDKTNIVSEQIDIARYVANTGVPEAPHKFDHSYIGE